MIIDIRNHIVKLVILLYLTLFSYDAVAKLQWQPLASGIEYTTVNTSVTPNGRIHAFRIDLSQNKLDLAFASEHHAAATTVKSMAQESHALIAINGGFFTPELKPIGLRIKQGEIKSKLKATSWWGIFLINNNQAHIVAQQDYDNSKKVEFAVQGGPRLVADGEILQKLKSGTAERTALGITKNGKIVILVTDNAPLEMSVLADIMSAPEDQNGFNCVNALNLDGGSSTQLYAQIGDFNLNISGYSYVTDAVLVKPRSLEG